MKTAIKLTLALLGWLVFAIITAHLDGPGHRCPDTDAARSQFDPPQRCAP
jgi:hypothetical protein